MTNIKESQTIEQLIYSLEPVAYYFGLTPKEFWSTSFKSITIFCNSNLARITDEYKRNIVLQEAVTNKLIMSDAMSNKHPKTIPLTKTFKELFS